MHPTDMSSATLLSIVSAAFAETDGTPESVAEHVSKGFGADSIASAFAHGVLELAAYGAAGWTDDETAMDAEAEAVAASRRVVRPLFEAKLQVRLDALDAAHRGDSHCPKCGENAASRGRRHRQWTSMVGTVSLRRRYACCATPECDGGFAPAQNAIGLPEGEFTARFEEVCTLLATTVPFGMATGLLAKLCGIEPSIKAVQDMTERRGEAVLDLEAEQAEACTPFDETGLPVLSQERPTSSVEEGAAPDVAYIDMDGVVPITREELTGSELTPAERRRQQRAKKAGIRGGKGKRYRIVGREVKNAVLYDGKDCTAESPGRGCILSKSYVSHLGDWQSFGALLWVAMLRQRFDQAKLLVVLSDGAEWVRSLCEWLPVSTFLILDLFHVKHRVWQVAHSLYGERSPKAAQWARTQCDRIEAGDARKVIEALRFLRPTRTETRELVRLLGHYLKANLDRMDYPAYRARGLRVGSGAVESANFHVTGARLKLQGMRWSEAGARQMAALRADLFNGNHEARTREILAA
jgi:hypothetical protein